MKSINPSKWGIIKLTAFPVEATTWADEQMKRNQSYGNSERFQKEPFKRFCDYAVEYCNDNGIRPNWKKAYDTLRDEGMPDGASMLQQAPKKGYTSFNRAPITTSHTPSGGTHPQPSGRQYVTFGGIRCYELSEEEANMRRSEFITNGGVVASIDNLAKLMGQKPAEKYFERVLYNLKYMPIETHYVHNPRNLPEEYDHST